MLSCTCMCVHCTYSIRKCWETRKMRNEIRTVSLGWWERRKNGGTSNEGDDFMEETNPSWRQSATVQSENDSASESHQSIFLFFFFNLIVRDQNWAFANLSTHLYVLSTWECLYVCKCAIFKCNIMFYVQEESLKWNLKKNHVLLSTFFFWFF